MTADLARAQAAVASVPDPEMPYMTLADLGILRSVEMVDGRYVVTVTPTYSGCPATTEIARDVRDRMMAAGFEPVEVRTALSPAWTTDWITEEGRRKLAHAGVAPPGPSAAWEPGQPVPLTLRPTAEAVACPLCGSRATVEQSHFGATPCKSLHRCRDCAEPFEYVKPL